MQTVAEITVVDELVPLREIAILRGWTFKQLDGLRFHLGMPATSQCSIS